MIIACPKCNKQFQIDNSLISQEGRDLQCGSCNHVWFYEQKEEKSKILELREEIVTKEKETKVFDQIDDVITERKQSIEINKNKKIQEKRKLESKSQNNQNEGIKFFSYLVVFVISLIALIILLDTLKAPLIDVFPRSEIILFNLFETLQDIKLFIIDLI